MPDISKITLGDSGTTYNIKDAKKSGIYTVIGTQTASTNAFTGTIPINALYDGLTINYYIPYAPTSSSATLNLTLADGTTTGAKNVYITTSRFTTHIGAGRNIVMTYWSAGSISISGTPTTDDRWVCDGYYDQNDVVTLRSQYPRITAGGNGIKRNSLFSRTLDGTYSSFFSGTGGTAVSKTYDLTTYFDPTTIWYHQNSADIAVGAVTANNTVDFQHSLCDLRYSFSGITSSASTSTLEANKPVYVVFDKASESKGYYRLREPVWTQTPNDTNAIYTLVAYAYDVYRCDLWVNNPIFIYDGTNLVSSTINGHTVNADVPSGAVFTDSKVTQTFSGSDDDFPVLFSSTTTSNTTAGVLKSYNLTFNPVKHELALKQRTGDNSASFRVTDNSGTDVIQVRAGSTNVIESTGSLYVDGEINTTTLYAGDIDVSGSVFADMLNGETIGNSPKFTDTIGQIYYCETDSTSTTSAFVVTISGITALTDGLTICVKNTVGASVSGCTLNLNGLGAKTIWLSLDNAACTTEWKNNSIYIFVYDATNQRWVMNMGRDTDVTGNNIIARYSRLPSGGNNVKKYSLFAMLPSGVYSSFTTDSGTGSKTFDSTNYFDIRKIYAYGASSDRSTGDLLSPSGWKLQGYDIDMRYSFNGVTTKASTSSLTQDLPVYMVFNPSAESGGCYKIRYPYYTQNPTSTGCIYVLVGVMRDSYRLDFWFYNPAFTYDGTKLVPFSTGTNTPSTGEFTVNDVAIGGFTTGSGNYFKFSLPFTNTATSAVITSIDQSAGTKIMLPNTVLQNNFIDLSNSIVSSITKDWITFEFKLDSTQSANTPGTILIANLTFELF